MLLMVPPKLFPPAADGVIFVVGSCGGMYGFYTLVNSKLMGISRILGKRNYEWERKRTPFNAGLGKSGMGTGIGILRVKAGLGPRFVYSSVSWRSFSAATAPAMNPFLLI